MKARKKIELSKETLRDLTARPLTQAEVTLVAGAGDSDACPATTDYCKWSDACDSNEEACQER